MSAPDPLLAAIRAVPMRCADCGATSDPGHSARRHSENQGLCVWETDDAGIARAVRAFVRERMSREKVAARLYAFDPRSRAWPTWDELAACPSLRDDYYAMGDALLGFLHQELGDD